MKKLSHLAGKDLLNAFKSWERKLPEWVIIVDDVLRSSWRADFNTLAENWVKNIDEKVSDLTEIFWEVNQTMRKNLGDAHEYSKDRFQALAKKEKDFVDNWWNLEDFAKTEDWKELTWIRVAKWKILMKDWENWEKWFTRDQTQIVMDKWYAGLFDNLFWKWAKAENVAQSFIESKLLRNNEKFTLQTESAFIQIWDESKTLQMFIEKRANWIYLQDTTWKSHKLWEHTLIWAWPNNNIRIYWDDTISGNHLRIDVSRDWKVTIKDLSTNGTFIKQEWAKVLDKSWEETSLALSTFRKTTWNEILWNGAKDTDMLWRDAIHFVNNHIAMVWWSDKWVNYTHRIRLDDWREVDMEINEDRLVILDNWQIITIDWMWGHWNWDIASQIFANHLITAKWNYAEAKILTQDELTKMSKTQRLDKSTGVAFNGFRIYDNWWRKFMEETHLWDTSLLVVWKEQWVKFSASHHEDPVDWWLTWALTREDSFLPEKYCIDWRTKSWDFSNNTIPVESWDYVISWSDWIFDNTSADEVFQIVKSSDSEQEIYTKIVVLVKERMRVWHTSYSKPDNMTLSVARVR